MPITNLAKYIYDNLNNLLPGLEVDEKKQIVKFTFGNILEKKNGIYKLSFYWYNIDDEQYKLKDKYSSISFEMDFNIRSFLWINKKNGSYKLSREKQFKNIINPLGKTVKEIKINSRYKKLKFYKQILIIPEVTFMQVMRDSEFVYKKSDSYRKSTENYLSNLQSQNYSSDIRKRTTYIEKGEFNFLVDKFYLKTKKTKKDFLKYLDTTDIKSIELFLTELFRLDVLSPDFLKMLNERIIKKKLEDIIELGRSILALKTTNLKTKDAIAILQKMGIPDTGQLESVWQKYFEDNLLYLIFTYKRIYPKVKLKNIEGNKKYPDFIGINHYNGLDIIEIKTHIKNVLRWDNNHENFYFSSEMSKAIVQTTNYMDSIVRARFENTDDKIKIAQSIEEENLYHPRGIIIISSKSHLTNEKGRDAILQRDFTKLRNSVQNIEILTFNEIIDMADEYIKNITDDTEELLD